MRTVRGRDVGNCDHPEPQADVIEKGELRASKAGGSEEIHEASIILPQEGQVRNISKELDAMLVDVVPGGEEPSRGEMGGAPRVAG